MKKPDIYRYIPKRGKLFERFDAKLRGKTILRVELKYAENGEIERVDIFCE